MKKDARVTDGQCLCGAVKFRLQGRLRSVVNCYCGQCRRCHGAFAAYTQVLASGLTMLNDAGLKWYRSSGKARRGFCSECGSSLFWCLHDSDRISISAGSLDQPANLKTGGHIYVHDLADFLTLPDDGLPRFDGTSAGKLDGDLST